MSALTESTAPWSMALWYASRATGIVAMILLSLVVVIGVLVSQKVKIPGLPRFAVVGLHRRMSLLAVFFVAVHVLSAVADSYVSIRLAAVVLPFTSAYRPLEVGLGAVALDLGIAVVVTSLLRARIGWKTWRLVHWLAYAAYPIAVLHGFTTAADLRSGALLAVAVTCLTAVAAAIAWRAWLPRRRRVSRDREPARPGQRSAGRAAAVR
jgi:methionine sulfoxide reductase heme-binding subunit